MVMMMTQTEWDSRHLQLAKEVSTWSKDPSKKIGAIAVSQTNRILCTGYNGFPRGFDDSEERYNNREIKYKYVVHAEKNLIYNACLEGISLKDSKVYVWGLPVCSECAKGLIQVGVSEIYISANSFGVPKWDESFKMTRELFEEAKITIYVLHN